MKLTKYVTCSVLVLLGLWLAADGCKKKAANPEPTDNTKVEQDIVALYYQWAGLSSSHHYSDMLALSYPGGNFEGMSTVCKGQWDSGTEMYYAFNSVKVKYWDTDGTPFVVGNSTLYQGPSVPPIYRGFASSCRKQSGQWKLDGMNQNNDPDWWK